MVDERTTIVVADTSGSMGEHGKAMLVRNLLGHIRQSGVSSPDTLILVQWSSDASVLVVPAHEDLPLLPIRARAAIQPLLALLDEITVEGGRIGILVLSDGHLAVANVNAFCAWVRRRPNISVRAIAVGPDASLATLARMAGAAGALGRRGPETASLAGRGWFRPEDICSALESWPPTARSPELPARIAELVAEASGDRR